MLMTPVITPHQFITFDCEFPVYEHKATIVWHIATLFLYSMEEKYTSHNNICQNCLPCLLPQREATAMHQFIGGKSNGIFLQLIFQCRCMQSQMHKDSAGGESRAL